MINYKLFGLSDRWFLLTNSFLHAIVTILFFLLLKNLSFNTAICFFSALLFAIHPVHTEVLNVAVYRTELLAALFFIGSFSTFLKQTTSKNKLIYLSSLLLFLLGLGCKETIASLPLIFGIYTWLFIAKEQRKTILLQIIPFLVIIVLWITLQKYVIAPRFSLSLKDSGSYNLFFLSHTHWRTIIYVLGKVFPRYLFVSFLPLNFILWYPQTNFGYNPSIMELTGILFLILLIAILILYRKRLKIFTFGIMFFFIALLPVSYIFPMTVVHGERWLYIPSMGITMIMGYLFYTFYKKTDIRFFVIILLIILILFYGIKSNNRNKKWHNMELICKEDTERFPLALYSHIALADELIKNGKHTEALEV
jgi:hypothetical protein